MKEMPSGMQERALRLLLASFMRSDLSVSDLRDLSEQLERDPLFLQKFSGILRDALNGLIGTPISTKEPALGFGGGELLDQAYSYVKRRRLSKAEVVGLMDKFRTPATRGLNPKSASMKEHLSRFFSEVPSDIGADFLAALTDDLREDPYLRGITKRR